MSKRRPVKFMVCGKEWKAKFLAPSTFTRKYGRKTGAITICDDKEIFFREGAVKPEDIRHEIFHAYIWEHGARSMSLKVDQMEELCAEMFSKHAEIILASSQIIMEALGNNP